MTRLHPQQTGHALSLLSASQVEPSLHALTASASKNVQAIGAANAQAYWMNASKTIDWIKPPEIAYGRSASSSKPVWFPGATLNTAYNCLDRHVKDGYGDRVCFQHYSSLPAAKAVSERRITYGEALEECQVLAGVLIKMGVEKGDRVIIYMPMIIDTAIAMLACARIGAIHSVVFGGFAPRQLAARIDDAKPKIILAASCGIEPKAIVDYKTLLDEARSIAKEQCSVLLLRRKNITGHVPKEVDASRGEHDWSAETEQIRKSGKSVKECTPVESDHPLYILYTSGTTGTPKGVVRYTGGHAVGSCCAMQHTFGLKREDTILTASDFGWVVGHSFIVYCPLMVGATSVVFEGKPILPDAGVFWKMVEKFKVNVLFTAPTALRAIRREDPDSALLKKYNISSLRALFLAGERSEPGIITAYQGLLSQHAAPGAIVNDNYWSTESGSPITAIQLNSTFPPLMPKPGSAGLPLPGMDVRIVDDEGKELPLGTMGNIVLGLPLPPTALGTVWGNEKRFQEAYFDRFRGKGDFYDSGDAGVIDEQGYVSVLSRSDDVINVAGHRLGTSLIEQVVASHPFVSECCVVGLPDEMKGHVPFALVTRASSKKAQEANPQDLFAAVNKLVRQDIGSIATLGGLACGRLPKTRSG